MKSRIAALLLIAVLVLPLAGLALSVDEAYAAGDVTFTGVARDSDGNPLTGADVRLEWDAGDTGVGASGTVTSGSDGGFTVVLPGTYDDSIANIVKITYKKDPLMMICDDVVLEDYAISGTTFDLGEVDAVFEYTMGKNMTVVGTVKYGSELIPGATVSLLRSNGSVAGTDTTDSDGKYLIECEPGTYTVTVKRGGFEEAIKEDITVGTGTASSSETCDFQLVKTPEQTYWGLDLPHLFTLVGLFIAGILLIVVTAYVVYVRRHHGRLKIVDDED